MALGFNFDSGGAGDDIIPIVKWDARAGRMFRRDYMGNDADAQVVDISKNFKAVFLMDDIETGFINFGTGGAPHFHVTKLGSGVVLSPPTPDHKQGARILIKLSKECGGDVRELASTAKAFLKGLDQLHNDYLAGKAANPGKLPVVVLADTVQITSGSGTRVSTNYEPVFQITNWVAQPADLKYIPKATAAPAAAQGQNQPPALGATKVAAPAAPAAVEDDFG